jgi:S-DNA-T family DNA segregation ATPase FtsK/SpoIIIE
MPNTALLDEVPANRSGVSRETLLENAKLLEGALDNFDVASKVVEVNPGPVVTRYEVEPALGVKVNRIAALSDDLARVMSAKGIRIQAPVPGKSVVGVEIANQERETVYLREIIEDEVFSRSDSKLVMALGKTISGEPCAADLAKMPHLLVAGATGAGKSVCLNSLICSILLKATPDEVRFIMVDPKVVELMMYNDIPHLLVPVITEPKKAAEALKWAVAEMEARYQKLAKLGVRNLADYNAKLARVQVEAEAEEDGVEPEKPLANIVVVIDEFADLMLTAPADVETSLMGLAQKSRAVGIHIILATQRPSVNVITGVIKANFPSRIAFQVASKTDSRTILDLNGAERLLGMGDMLFLPSGQGEPIRVHGAFISGEETERLVEALKESPYEAEEVAVFSEQPDINVVSDARDDLFDDAVRLVAEHRQASTSFLQRRLKVGYSRAGRLMDELEAAGIVGPIVGAKPREILVESAEEEYAEE